MAHSLYLQQNPEEKRRLIEIVLLKSFFEGGKVICKRRLERIDFSYLQGYTLTRCCTFRPPAAALFNRRLHQIAAVLQIGL